MAERVLPYEVNCSILFTELPLLERPAAAREAGFDAVEFWWPFATAVPSDREVDEFVRAVGDAGVRLAGLNFFAGDMPGGDRGLVSWPARSGEFRDNLEVTVGIGERLGCRAFNALYGNRVEGADPAAQDDLAVENLALAGRAAARIGGTVLVEPVSGADRYPLRTAADAVAVIDRVAGETGVGNLGLLCDLYHLAVNGDDLDQVDRHLRRPGRPRPDRRRPRAPRAGDRHPRPGPLPRRPRRRRLRRLGRAGVQAQRGQRRQLRLAARASAADAAPTEEGTA